MIETLIGLAAAWAIVEGCSALGLRLLHRTTGIFYAPRDAPRLSPVCAAFLERFVQERGVGKVLEFDTTLGWTVGSHRQSPDGRQETDAHGVRTRQRHPVEPASDRVRIATFGDCLTYGEGGSLETTWQAWMERLDPRLEVLNFGVDGYGIDQCYLRYLETRNAYTGQRFVFIGLVSSNVYKSVNAFRPFYSYDHEIHLAKPRFRLVAGDVVRVDNPLPDLEAYRRLLENPETELQRLGACDDYYGATYRRRAPDVLPSVRLVRMLWHEVRKLRAVRHADGSFVEGSTALEVTRSVCETFCDRVRAQGAQPVVLLLPTPSDLKRFRRHGTVPWRTLAARLQTRGETVVDLLDVLGNSTPGGTSTLFDGRHYSPRAHEIMARHLVELVHRLLDRPHLDLPASGAIPRGTPAAPSTIPPTTGSAAALESPAGSPRTVLRESPPPGAHRGAGIGRESPVPHRRSP